MRRPSRHQRAQPVGARRSVAVLALLALAALGGACGSSGHAANSPGAATGAAGTGTSNTTIVIKNFAFEPASLTVNPGATVTVRNEDPTTHTLTAISPHDKVFDTGDVAAGATKTFTAPDAPGSYPYICEIHQFMHGTLTVK